MIVWGKDMAIGWTRLASRILPSDWNLFNNWQCIFMLLHLSIIIFIWREKVKVMLHFTSVQPLNVIRSDGEIVGFAFLGWELVESRSSVGCVIWRGALQFWKRGENLIRNYLKRKGKVLIRLYLCAASEFNLLSWGNGWFCIPEPGAGEKVAT